MLLANEKLMERISFWKGRDAVLAFIPKIDACHVG